MRRKTLVTIALVAALVAVFGVSFAIGGLQANGHERFTGTDSAATAQIQAANPGYQPWFTPFFQPESSEIESGLFALQAAIGGCVLGFAIGALWGRRRATVPAAETSPVQASTVDPTA
ncbi:MAG TPA: energy-coupling factor ABC transporter substrate-binding protein [Propionicimonas sp.]|jgi:cobalt/nickel transport protein|uniref:energy-coupling factor ABC transporter substrate-binding protein n=1 Tax=Propionicimonas sp. TaxID=1955623 RepID=UPI002F415FC3